MNYMITPNIYTPRSAEHTAALFLLTFQEKYRLSQTATNFSVGSINSIVDSVLESIKESTEMDISFFSYSDPFSSLQTEYQQSKFYREQFGLVVIYYFLKVSRF